MWSKIVDWYCSGPVYFTPIKNPKNVLDEAFNDLVFAHNLSDPQYLDNTKAKITHYILGRADEISSEMQL